MTGKTMNSSRIMLAAPCASSLICPDVAVYIALMTGALTIQIRKVMLEAIRTIAQAWNGVAIILASTLFQGLKLETPISKGLAHAF